MISFNKWLACQHGRHDHVGEFARKQPPAGPDGSTRGRTTRKTTLAELAKRSATTEEFTAAKAAWAEYERIAADAAG